MAFFLLPYFSPTDHVYPASPASLLFLEHNYTQGLDFEPLPPW